MNATTTRPTKHTSAASRPRSASARVTARRRPAPMPRATTRVIWTMSQGTMVEYGEPR